MTNPAAEGGEVDTLMATELTVTGGMLERWVSGADPDAALKKIDTLVVALDRLRAASIRSTYPSDWIIHTSKDADGNILRQVGYLQDVGAERAGKIWGIEIGKPDIEREDFPDGTYAYKLTAEAWSKVTGEKIEHAQGSRWSGDNFFARQKGPDEKVDPTDVMKAAYANLHGRAVRALAGLGGVPLEKLRDGSIDITKVVMVGYEKGGKGGESTGASVGTSDVTMGWGDSKGKTPAELADKDLAYYLGAYSKSLADPSKAKFARSNQRAIDALKAEQQRRETAPAAGSDGSAADGGPALRAGGTEPSTPAAPTASDDRPTNRGSKVATLWTLLTDASKADSRLAGTLLKHLTAEKFGAEVSSMSDLTEPQLDTLLLVPAKEMADKVEALKAKK